MVDPQEIFATSFLGPWVPQAKDGPRRRHVYLSLAHWYEAAKFMPHAPAHRDAVAFCPTVAEARKYARLREPEWRSDWQMTRHSVLIAGLAMLTLQRPELELQKVPLDGLKGALSGHLKKVPERFVDACLGRFDQWRTAPRIAVFGAEAAPNDVVGTRMAKLVAPMPSWTLITTSHRRTPWTLHDWALSHYVPVQYVGQADARASRPLARQVVEAADHVIVFEQRRDKRFDHVIQHGKELKRKLTLELYDAAGGAGSPGQLALA